MGRTEAAAERARAFGGVRGSATALMERLDALTDPERVEDAAMLAGWRAVGGGGWGGNGRIAQMCPM